MSNLVIEIAPEFRAEAQRILDAIDSQAKNKNKKRKIKQTKKAGKK